MQFSVQEGFGVYVELFFGQRIARVYGVGDRAGWERTVLEGGGRNYFLVVVLCEIVGTVWIWLELGLGLDFFLVQNFFKIFI